MVGSAGGWPCPGASEMRGARIGLPQDDTFATARSLEPLLHPRGVAVVGASAEPGKFSSLLIPSLRACGYGGLIYPVNPRADAVAGLPCYPSVTDVPEPCDLAIVAVPARHVVGVVQAAADRGVGAAVILSAGFEELSDAGGEARARALRDLSGRILIYGPNCPGLWQIRDGLVYTFSSQFSPDMLVPGPVGLVTQGGALGRTVLDAMATGLGFSYWFSTGNEAGLDLADFVAFLATDPGTRVVAVIAEGWRDGRRFLRAAARCRQAGKPVLVLKIGRTPAGGGAARAHTGARNGDTALTSALLRRAGCSLVADIADLTELARLAARSPLPAFGGLGICSFSGGAGGLLADLAQDADVPLPGLAPDTAAALAALLPEIATIGNPTDLTTAALADPGLVGRALAIMAADPDVAALAFPLPHRLDRFDAALAPVLASTAAAMDKPLAVIAMSPTFPEEPAARLLRQAGVQVFTSAPLAIRTLAAWMALRPECRPPQAVVTEGWGGADPAGLPEARTPVPGGPDILLAGLHDPVFGPVVRCRLGAGPQAWRLAPCTLAAARSMLDELPVGAAPETWARAREAAARAVVTIARQIPGGDAPAADHRLRLVQQAPESAHVDAVAGDLAAAPVPGPSAGGGTGPEG